MPSSRLSPEAQRVAARVIALSFVLLGGLLALHGGCSLAQAHDSRRWPTSRGTVKASAEAFTGIIYEYEVLGTPYRGHRLSYGVDGLDDPVPAKEIASRYPVGAGVTVYHKPGNPGECVLEPGARIQMWVPPGFGMLLAAAGIALLVLLPKPEGKQGEAGAVP